MRARMVPGIMVLLEFYLYPFVNKVYFFWHDFWISFLHPNQLAFQLVDMDFKM